MRLPFFYGWVIVVVTFVTMAIGVNARTAFSLFFPPIIDEFGWERGITAGAFSFGFVVSAAQPADRPPDGPLWPARRDGTRRRADGGRPAAGSADVAALASLFDHRRHGRRRQRLSRLFRPIAVSAELVHSPARPRDGDCLRRRRHRLGHAAALGAADDRADRLAHRLHRDGHHDPGRAGADQPVTARAPRRHRPAAGRRRRADGDLGQAGLQHRRSGLGRHRLDAAARAAHRAVLVDCARLFLRPVHLVRGAGAPDQIPARHRLQLQCRGLGTGRGQPARHSRPDLARASVRPGRTGMDLGRQLLRLCDLLRGADRAEILSDPGCWSIS